MKKILIPLFGFVMAVFTACTAQNMKPIQLLEPTAERGGNLMTAFYGRQSIREYADRELSLQDLSDLVWAANGINRTQTGKRTVPTAQNKQEMTLYVVKPEGAYWYDAEAHVLQPVVAGDHRKVLAGPQAFAATAPVILAIVGDTEVFPPERNWVMTDAGYISQNIYLFCAGNGLGTVARGIMEKEEIHRILKLRPEQQVVLNHPVGYRK